MTTHRPAVTHAAPPRARCAHGLVRGAAITTSTDVYALGVLPITHLCFHHAFNPLSLRLLHNLAWMGGTYLVGAAVYLTQLPEALVPRTFDYSFNSHQLWHVAVVTAAYLHWQAVQQLWAATSIATLAAA